MANLISTKYCGDFAEHVAENRKRLATELGIDTAHIIMPHQVHIDSDLFGILVPGRCC